MKLFALLFFFLLGGTATADCLDRVSEEVDAKLTKDVLPLGLPDSFRELVWLIGARETNLNDTPSIGGAGEVGPFQVLPTTAAPYLEPGEDLSDPKVNARVATQYLTELLLIADGDYLLAIAAWNFGPKAMSVLRARRSLPKVTANYLVFVIHLAKEQNCAQFLTRVVRPNTNK